MNIEKMVNSRIYRVFDWIWRLAILNILCLITSLGIITILPSLSACYKSISKYLEGSEENVFSLYFTNLKRHFIEAMKGNILVLAAAIVFVFAILFYQTNHNTDSILAIISIVGFYFVIVLIIISLMIILQLPMIYENFELNYFEYFYFAIFISFRNIFHSIIFIVIFVLFSSLFYFVLPIWLVVGVSFPLFIGHLLFRNIYWKLINTKKMEEEKMLKLGIDNIDEYLEIFKEKRVGLITNPTGVNSYLTSTIDVLKEKVNLVCLFAPEHGVRGDIQAGLRFETYIDKETNIPVYSLYTKDKKPTKEMLEEVDIVCIDIQDVGSRFYTYIYTMAYSMMACSEHNKEFVVFDRPNPIGGEVCEGNILDLNYRSFIGYYPIIQRHGMTIAELAKMFNEKFEIGTKLTIIPMSNWTRNMDYNDTGLLWLLPSPNIPTVDTAYVYSGTCIFEGTNVSEGRGTTKPFEYIGAPYIDAKHLATSLNDLNLNGVIFAPITFTPTFSKHKDELCKGVQIHIIDYKTLEPVKMGWAMLHTIAKMYPRSFAANPPYKEGANKMLDLNLGLSYESIRDLSLEELYKIIDKDTKKFKKERKQYLLY